MKLKLSKETLKILTEGEAALVGGASPGPTPTGTECGPTCLAACGNNSATDLNCTNNGCVATDINCATLLPCGGGGPTDGCGGGGTEDGVSCDCGRRR
jgi:hypothetical protein